MTRTLLPLAFLLAGCPADPATDTDPATDSDSLEIVGLYVDGFGGTHDISETSWVMDGIGIFAITQFDNADQVLIAQNDSTNAFNPDLWSRLDWADDGTQLWFCQTAFDAATEADALATPAADASDLETAGCGGFPWSSLTRQ